MKKLNILITVALAPLLFSVTKAQTLREDLQTQLLDPMPKTLASHNVPGVAIAIFHQGEQIVESLSGFADLEEQQSITSQTGFNIGSVSKTFTAWGVMKLVEKGRVALSDQVERHLKQWRFPAGDFDGSTITIQMLLSHTAGLSVHGYEGLSNSKQLPTIEGSLNGTKSLHTKVEILSEPGTAFKYSGGGYTVLQLMIEDVTGQSFEKYMEQEVFEPLNMRGTSFKIGKDVISSSSKPYNEEGKEIPLRFFTAKAAAGLHTNLEDMIKFVKASFGTNPVLTDSSLKILREPTEQSGGDYGLGHMIMNRFGSFTLTGHGGSNEGWEAGFLIDYATNSGVLILTNSSAGKAVIFQCLGIWAKLYGNSLSGSD